MILKLKLKPVFALCLLIVAVSFLGFCVENLWRAVTAGCIDNRNMYLPFLLGYGVAIAAIYLVFGTPNNPRFLCWKWKVRSKLAGILLYFLCMTVCVFVGEILLGTLVEKLCGVVWWNYSWLPLHITKYTSVPTTLCFATIITFFMNRCFLPLFDLFMELNPSLLAVLAFSLSAALLIDYLACLVRMYKQRTLTPLWSIDTTRTKFYKTFRFLNRYVPQHH